MLSHPNRGGKDHYAAYLRAAMARGGWYPRFRCWSSILTSREADLVCYLISCGRTASDETTGWMPATPAYVRQGTGMPLAVQERVLASLAEEGIVEVTHRGGTRHVRVHTDRLDALLADVGDE